MIEDSINLAAILNADTSTQQALSIFIPDRDKFGNELGNQRKWVLEAVQILSEIGGGVTMLKLDGVWINDQNQTIWENTVQVYTYINPDQFEEKIDTFAKFAHRFGKEANQGEVLVVFNNRSFKIRHFNY